MAVFNFEKPINWDDLKEVDARIRYLQDEVASLTRQLGAKTYELRLIFDGWEKRIKKPPATAPGSTSGSGVVPPLRGADDVLSLLRAVHGDEAATLPEDGSSLEPLPDE